MTIDLLGLKVKVKLRKSRSKVERGRSELDPPNEQSFLALVVIWATPNGKPVTNDR